MKEKSCGLYNPVYEKDSCGIGFVANLKGNASHKIVDDALIMLENMEHRGATGSDPETGDGAGVLIQIPHLFFREECAKINIILPEPNQYGIGMVFFPQQEDVKEACRERLLEVAELLGLEIIGYRALPTDNSKIGTTSRSVELNFEQIFIKLKNEGNNQDLERKLFVFRKHTTHSIGSTSRLDSIAGNNYQFYWASLSTKTIVYKGQLRTDQVKKYFHDLNDTRIVSALALVHSRFSTNTFPNWKLAQPFRYIAHNGEINTIRGNVNWMKSKQALFESDFFTKEELDLLLPVVDGSHSDSANLDAIIEMLVLAGRSLPRALMMVIPEAWQGNDKMDEDKRAFYEYHSSLMEPWDGPASISFTDGNIIGATLDRNGLRPSRYCLTSDDIVIMSSEAGSLPIDESKIIMKGRLQPGKMFVADLKNGRIINDDALKKEVSTSKPYKKWLTEHKVHISKLPSIKDEHRALVEDTLLSNQLAFGYSQEDLKVILGRMAQAINEPLGSMGIDTPLAVLNSKNSHLSNYFKQQFAQVSNPPIDPIREKMVMSLFTKIGSNLNILSETPEHCKEIQLDHPVLNRENFLKLKEIKHPDYKSVVISCTFNADGQSGRLETALDKICADVEKAVYDGHKIIILSNENFDIQHAPVPSLLAVGAVHHHLINKKLRSKIGIIAASGDIRETHHFATAIAYGANAIYPFLAFESIASLVDKKLFTKAASKKEAFENYIGSIKYGLLKVLSKMGISTIQSYHGAQIFEILGLGQTVVNKCFAGTTSPLGGARFDDLAQEVLDSFRNAYPTAGATSTILKNGGKYQWKEDGEAHLFNPKTIHFLQKASKQNSYETYKQYATLINEQATQNITLRSLFDFKQRTPVSLDEVEPIENIFKRFATGAMSFGSISYEAHSTLAIAMNRIGGKSNSGEGGEDESRFPVKENGDWERSSIKQVASGRFGVTSNYLTNATEIQIKMAQGAKPGEGGQLPGHKVNDWIGRVRNSTPGVGLISPPPHHDIYSIEDLKQLIFDLKNANRAARINVKLVAKSGVGTIAAGVAKAKADVILISGYDGGTGASPISSIQHTGIPWEMGLAEAHQTLVLNKLRDRVTLQTDGQIRTGRDLAIATLLGAEEWGIATAALVVEGCIMMRKCHLNTCPVGIATQNPKLRQLFTGSPDDVVNFFTFLAQDLREIMAALGFRTINEMVGKSNVLKVKNDINNSKLESLDLTPIFKKMPIAAGTYKQVEQDHEMNNVLDWELIKQAKGAIESQAPVSAKFKIINTDRTVGAMLSNEISKKYGSKGLEKNTIHYKFKGSAGQSFGAFCAPGIHLELEGESNDYFGKGLSGGIISVYPHEESTYVAEENMIIGNVAFYGAVTGESYIRGFAGERFCVRNSGAKVVVEGIGDNGCEYMTGGCVVILGAVGRNFAAGMSGGIAYVYDPNKTFHNQCNMGMVDLDPLDSEDIITLTSLLSNHVTYTGSTLAEKMLADKFLTDFIKVFPRDYKAVLAKNKTNKEVKTV